ncbi:MAG: H-type lectin domain-containing protein [Parcubacteria group bacterium]
MGPGNLKIKIFLTAMLIMLGGFFVCQKSALAAVGINKQINFQGKVVNSDGTNVADASYDFVFRIYDQQAPGGTLIWTESKSLAVDDGIFQTNLGDTTSLPGSVDFNADNIFLGIEFNSNGEMEPRVQFTAAPYAFNADKLDGQDWSVPGAIGSVTPNSGSFTALGVLEGGISPIYKTIFQAADQAADITYTLPAIADNGLLKNTGGTLSWDTSDYLVNPMSALGDIVYGGTSGAPTRLAGSAGFLTSTGSAAPSWTAASTDYFSQYALLDGRNGGQILIGGTADDDTLVLQGNSASGNTAGSSNIVFNVGNGGATTALSLLNSGDSDFNHNEAKNFRVENADGSVLTPDCDASNQGRMYYDTNADSAFVCIETAPSVYGWFDYTATSVYSNKVVTVGTGGDYSTLAAGASYLNTLGGGIILLTPETHNVTSSVDLSNINLIGANTGDTRINITGAGVLRVKETQFKSLTIYVDSAITALSGIDAKYDAATTTSVIFEWVDFITNGTKVLLDSSDATSPVIRTRFISVSATSGTQKILLPKASSNIDASSTNFVESQGGSGALDLEDWDVKIAGSSNVKTSGTITTIPASTLYVYPGMNIQAAINSVSSGGVITLLPGVHNISSTLLIDRSDIQIQGYGDSSIVRAAGFVGGDQVAAFHIGSLDGSVPQDGVVLKDFRLEVSGTGATDIHGIRVAGGEDNQILNISVVKIAGASGTAAGARIGIFMIDGTAEKLARPVIKGCRVLGDSAATAYFTDGIHVTGGAGYGVGSGVWTNGQGVDGALVDGNYVDYVRETVAVFVGTNNSSLFNNRFTRMGAGGGGAFGVFMGNASNVNMTANVVSTSLSTASSGIVIDGLDSGSLKQMTDSAFTSNTVDGSANGGVGFGTGVIIGAAANTGFHRNLFTNNIINGASDLVTVAIRITGNADDNNFSNNSINGISNAWDTGINIVSNTAERNFIGKNAFINTTATVADAGVATQLSVTQHNAAVNPTANEDAADGYVVGTVWVNTATSTAYIATSVVVGAATWEQIDGAAGGSSTLQSSYDIAGGNTITTTTGKNIAFTLGEVATPTSFTIENQDTAGVSAERIFNSIASGVLTNGLLFEQTGAGSVTNAINILETAGAISTGINIGNNIGTGISIGTGLTTGISVGSGGIVINGGALAVDNAAGITSNQAALNVNVNGTGTGNVQIGDGGAASATPDMLVLDSGSAEPAGTDGAMYYSTALGKFRCYENGSWKDCISTAASSLPDTAVFTDATPAAWTDSNTTEVFNDATKPNIATDSASSTVLVHVQVYGQTSNTNADAILAARIVRTTDGSDPSCASATNVGVPIIGNFTTSTSQPWQIVGTFIDSPATTGTIKYTVCTSSDSAGTATDTPNQVIVELAELGADLAENYYTQDDSIEPGDVVAINGEISAGIKKSEKIYDQNVIGVISTNPGITLDDAIGIGQGRAVAVALAGRIPVKVSSENGRVVAGDYLTASSVPGVAMKATKAGLVIGQALQDFGYADDTVGLVLTFVKNAYFNGTQIADSENEALSGTDLLQKLLLDKAQIDIAAPVSEIVGDRLVAGLEVVTPQVVADSIIAKTIKAEHIEGLEIMETGIQSAQDAAEDNTNEVKSLGQKIADIQKTIKSLSVKSGELIINGIVEFRERVSFKSAVEFLDKAIFRKDVEFAGQAIFNQDTAGYAVINDGQDSVKIKFEKEYAEAPVVNASLSLQQIDNDEVRQASEDLLLLSGIRFIITDVTENGFEIRIDQKAISEITFSWQAVAVKDAKISVSDSKDKDSKDKQEYVATEESDDIKSGDSGQVMAEDDALSVENAEITEADTAIIGDGTVAVAAMP